MSKKYRQSIKEAEADIEKAKNRLHTETGNKLNEIREEKLYSGTFDERIKEETGYHPKYGYAKLRVSKFGNITGKFNKDFSAMRHNAKDHFFRNHSKRVEGQRKEKYSNKFTPLLEQIIGITIDSNNGEIVGITPRIVNTCNEVITDFLNAENLECSDSQIEKVTKRLKENYESLVSICKERLKTTVISKTSKTCNHLLEILSIRKNLLTLKCGCVFRLDNI